LKFILHNISEIATYFIEIVFICVSIVLTNKGNNMNLSKVIYLIGGKLKLAKALKLAPSTLTSWGKRRVPERHTDSVKTVLSAEMVKRAKAFDEVMK